MTEALMSVGACLGAIAGILIAALIYWVGPANLDVAHLGAWLVGLGAIAGLPFELIARKKK